MSDKSTISVDDRLSEEAAKERESQRQRRKNSPAIRPLPQNATFNDHGTRYSLAQRAQALTMSSLGYQYESIVQSTGIPRRSVVNIIKKARERGFDPKEDPRILDHFIVDGHKSGRPKEIKQIVETEVLTNLRQDRASREKSTEVLAYEHGVSVTSITRILHKNGLSNVKPTRKPGLNKTQRRARLEFCLAHQHWTLEDWKKVIWSDETSVVLCRRGSQRIWRGANEAFEKSSIRNRWKGFSEFMFWGCFSYYEKGPYHIWKPETIKEKEAAQKEIDELNKVREPEMKLAWELESGLSRLGLRNRPGRKPQWRFTAKQGKLVREVNKGGIDWYRYYKEIVQPKMIPFAKRLGPQAIVQEDNAAPHAQHFISTVYSMTNVKRLLWPGNSPDLNAIEKAWPWIKKRTTFHGPAKNTKELHLRWRNAWIELPQSQIQKWIEGIVENIKKVIELDGGNEYLEGRETRRSYKGRRKIGELYKHCWINDSESPIANDEDYEDIDMDEADDAEGNAAEGRS